MDKATPGQALWQTAIGKVGFINDLVDMVHWWKTQRGGGRRPAAAFLNMIGKADANIAANGSGTVSIWHVRSGAEVDAGWNETAYDWFGTGAKSGDRLLLWRHQESGRLYFASEWGVVSGRALRGVLDGSLSQGGSATVSIWAVGSGGDADTNENVIAYDWLMKSGATAIATGKKVVVQYFPDSDRWYVTEAECA